MSLSTVSDGSIAGQSPPSRFGQSVVDCGQHGVIMFGGMSTSDGVLNNMYRLDAYLWSSISVNGKSGCHLIPSVSATS